MVNDFDESASHPNGERRILAKYRMLKGQLNGLFTMTQQHLITDSDLTGQLDILLADMEESIDLLSSCLIKGKAHGRGKKLGASGKIKDTEDNGETVDSGDVVETEDTGDSIDMGDTE